MSTLLNQLSPEDRLVARCMRARPDAASLQAVETQLRHEEIDWDELMRYVVWQGVEPLVHNTLDRFRDDVPDGVLEKLQARARQAAFHNLRHLRELDRLLNRLETDGIPVIPFKGPMLAETVYGNVAYRRFGDLDILIHRSDFERTKALLLEDGYRPARDFDAAAEQEHLDTQMGYEFVHPERDTVVEVHWAFFFEIYSFNLTPEEVWSRQTSSCLGGVAVRALAPEDLIIYLCAHGTKHRWLKLTWVTDVAEFVRQHPGLEWSVVEERARRLGCARMLRLGLLLAHEVLDAPVPRHLIRQARQSRTVRLMVRQVVKRWLFREPDAPEESELTIFSFHWKERERLLDRWPHLKYHLQLWLRPTEEDMAFVKLPVALEFLYYLVRPVRLLMSAGQR